MSNERPQTTNDKRAQFFENQRIQAILFADMTADYEKVVATMGQLHAELEALKAPKGPAAPAKGDKAASKS